MTKDELSDRELEGAAGGWGRTLTAYCSKVPDSETFSYYFSQRENDCPYFEADPRRTSNIVRGCSCCKYNLRRNK